MPVLHGLHRRLTPQGGLRQLRVGEVDLAYQGLLQIKGAVEAVGFHHVADAAVESFHHAIGLRRLWWGQAVLDAQFSVEPVELVADGWCPIGKFFSTIGQYLGYDDRAGPVQIALEAPRIVGGLGGHDPHKDPTRRAVDGDEQATPTALIDHLRQIFRISMQEAGLAGIEGLVRPNGGLWPQSIEIAYPVAAQTPMQARARHIWVQKLTGYRQQII